MNRQDAFIFTHYTEITESKQRDVHRLQAEMAHSILRGLGTAISKALHRSPRGNKVRSLDQA